MDTLPADQIEALRERIRRTGKRATGSRLAALSCLTQAASPLSHGEVMERLEPQGWDRASIFRVLNDLADAKLLRRIDLGDHLWRFELLADEPQGHAEDEHAHFMCVGCGEVQCLPELSLVVPKSAQVPRSLREDAVQVRVLGRCDTCA